MPAPKHLKLVPLTPPKRRYGVTFKANGYTLTTVYFDTEAEAKAHAASFFPAIAPRRLNGSSRHGEG